MQETEVFYIDLFCGAGGTTTGIHMSNAKVKVVACVNHDPEAIRCHKHNHPECIHFTEDIRDFEVVKKIKVIITKLREKYPSCKIILGASLECTHFSNAAGAIPRNTDSRTLANHLFPYIEELDPDFIDIENVREFLKWGPLDNNGRPIKKLKGIEYDEWVKKMCYYGYDYQYKLMNSADFGAYTSRLRYFGFFVRRGYPIDFPTATHSKKGQGKTKWKPVKEVLELDDHGVSIFGKTKQGKPYSDKTLARIYDGLLKFTPEKVFLTSYYGNGGSHSIDAPCGALTTKDRYAIHFINYDYSNSTQSSIEAPAGAITTNPKHNLITIQWLFDTQYSNKGRSINESGPTIIARMDKKPIYMASAIKEGNHQIELPTDSEIRRKIKRFMRQNGITDVKIRMLKVPELLRIQGFPSNYEIIGTKANQLKFIGNSVSPVIESAIIEEKYYRIQNFRQNQNVV